MQQYTLAIIKSNAIVNGHTGPIITQIEQAEFHVKQLCLTRLTLSEAESFYAVHAMRPFYQDLCTYISSASVIVMVLQKENAITDFRTLIGATDPVQAAPGTLRAQFGTSIGHNALHGSDAEGTASTEITFFFARKGW